VTAAPPPAAAGPTAAPVPAGAPGPTVGPVPPGAVAVVAGRPITVAQLDERAAAIRRGPLAGRLPDRGEGGPEGRRGRRFVARLLVDEAVIRHEAARARVAEVGEPEAGTAGDLRAAVRALFELVTADVEVPEAAARSCYERTLDRWRRPETRRVRHVLLGTEAAAAAVARRARAGDDLAALARRHSLDDTTAAAGGDLGELRRGDLVGPFEQAMFGATPGAVTGPVRTSFGWHVLRVETVTAASVTPYQTARPALVADLLAAARGARFDAWLDGRRAAVARVHPDYQHPGDPTVPDTVHRH
jgi:[acyl-carrier-protein] S-malonyltransferase